MTRDAIGLVYALGHRSVAMVVGHDAGAPVAAWSALIRPDIFRSVTIMIVIENKKKSEVAAQMAVSVNTVKSQLTRAISILRKRFGGDGIQ